MCEDIVQRINQLEAFGQIVVGVELYGVKCELKASLVREVLPLVNELSFKSLTAHCSD